MKKDKSIAESEKMRERISGLQKTIAELKESKDNYKTLIDNASDGILINTDSEGKIIYTNRRVAEITGYSVDELVRTSIKDHSSPDRLVEDMKLYQQILKGIVPPTRHETAIVRKNGDVIPVEMTGSVINWYGKKALAVIIRDISERKKQEIEERKNIESEKNIYKEKAWQLTHYDALTDLLNRARFIELLNKWISDTTVQKGVLLLIDIDQFKFVSDTYGHGMGDELLRRLARLLQITLKYINSQYFNETENENIISRLTSDEFAIFLPSAGSSQAVLLAEQLRKSIEGFYQPDIPLHLTASIGISLYPEHGTTVSELLTKADVAMFRAKELGRNKVHFYNPEDQDLERMHSRLLWKENIVKAMSEDRFEVWLQPILDLKHEKVRLYEVLARMRSIEGEVFLPGPMIDIAERFGLVESIERVIIEKAFMFQKERNGHGDSLTLCINISGKDLNNIELLHFIHSKLHEINIDPNHLIFEITETASIADINTAIKFLKELKSRGCCISLDDFGIGFTSFLYLKELHIDYVKIAGPFIKNLADNLNDQLFVKAIVNIAKGLNIKTVAEFVEKEETLEFLRKIGVDYAQGYAIGRPSPVSDYKKLAS